MAGGYLVAGTEVGFSIAQTYLYLYVFVLQLCTIHGSDTKETTNIKMASFDGMGGGRAGG